ncbi:MAG: oxidoreductase [bacterium]
MSTSREKIKEMEVMVAETIPEAPDTVTLVLFTGNDTLNYAPGHFLTISPHQFPSLERWVRYLEDLKRKKEPPRAYSLSSSPDERYLAITIKEERYISGVTPYPPLLSPILAKRTLPGTKMVITGFTGPYTLTDQMRSSSENIVHICAGSGVVPSYSIIKHDLRVNEKSRHTLVYSNKVFDDVIFFDQLRELEKEFPHRFRVIHTLTRETDERVFDDQIRRGRISKGLIQEVIQDPSSVTVFACGPDHSVSQKKAAKEKGETLPPSFLGSVLAYLAEMGVARERIKKESYG